MAEIGTGTGTEVEEVAVAAVMIPTVRTPGHVPAVVVVVEAVIKKNS